MRSRIEFSRKRLAFSRGGGLCKRRYTEILHRADRVLLLSAIGDVIYLAKQTASCSVCRGTKTRAIARAFRGRSVCWRARTSLRETINYHWPLVDRAMSRCSLPAFPSMRSSKRLLIRTDSSALHLANYRLFPRR